MRIARTSIVGLVLACLATAASGQPGTGFYPPGAPAGYGPNPSAGYPGPGYPMQAYGGPQGYGMPMMQPAMQSGYGAMHSMQPAGVQQLAPEPYASEDGPSYATQGAPYGQTPAMAAPMSIDGEPPFSDPLNGEPSEAPVIMPQARPPFTWIPPPTGSRILSAMGPPYAALRDSDGCNQGLLGDWGQIVRSRIGQFYVRAEAIMLRRSNPGGGQPLFVTNLGLPSQTTALSTSDLGFRNEIGQRMTVGLATSQRSSFEVTYLALQNWSASAGATGTADLFLAGNLATLPTEANAFAFASSVSAVEATMLQSLEFNYVATTVFERLSLIGGFRYLDLRDALDLTSNSPAINGVGGNGTGTFTMNTLNQLYGGQGGVVLRQNLELLTVELSSKAGVYENYATQTQVLNNNNITGTLPRTGFGSRDTSAFVGDIGLSGVYHFSNFFALRFGYNVIFIDNVALAPGQINLNANTSNNNISSAGNGLNHDSNLFLYGVNLGLDARF